VRACRAALPALVDRGSGAIVNVASVNSFLPDPSVVDYCASKAALASLSKALSMEFGPKGIRVNAVAPGPVRTPFWVGPGGVADQMAEAAGTDREGALRIAAAGWAASPSRASSPSPRRSRRWSCCWCRIAWGTSPAPPS
jgi:NAD(P)-dependent dehydrogenase (short-subunit alcohol dehydrogenase family)